MLHERLLGACESVVVSGTVMEHERILDLEQQLRCAETGVVAAETCNEAERRSRNRLEEHQETSQVRWTSQWILKTSGSSSWRTVEP